MSYKLKASQFFVRELKQLAKKYPNIRKDIDEVSEKLLENPFYGVQIAENCYKIRFSISGKNRGKSGGGRIITFLKIEEEMVYLIGIYDKSNAEIMPEIEILARVNSI
jgi:mRNA-degrading endonuclease RelE of RelBE toxin-antitoxin system